MVVELQLSELPLSTSAAVMLALPEASNWTVMSWHIATGAKVSSIVTVAVQLLLLPEVSVTVRVTVLGPISLQSKVAGETVILLMAQLSLLPLSTSAVEMVACPVASSCTVIFWHTAFGASSSVMVTVKEQVCTGFVPSSYSKVLVVVPIGKVPPLAIPAVWVKVPPPQPLGESTV